MTPLLSQHRKKLVPAAVTATLLILALVFWRPLTAWFGGEPTGGSGDPSAFIEASAGPFTLQAQLEPDPPREKGNTLILQVLADGEPVEDAQVTATYVMPPMGGMAEMRGEADIKERGDGRYVGRFDLPMGGSWSLETDVTSGERTGSAVFSFTVGSAGLSLQSATGSGPFGNERRAEPVASLPQVELPPAAVARINAAFAATDQVRAALASDSLGGVPAQATSIGAALDAAAEDQEVPDAMRAHLKSAADDARALSEADTLETARERFSDLSGALVALAEADPRLAEGWHIFKCPMTEGHGKWFQRTRQLENPYMGQEMLTCGVGSDWELAAQVTHEGHAHSGGDEVAYYTCSMHPSVKQDEPGDCPICGMDLTPVTKEQVETGILFVDEMRRQRIGVRTAPVQKRTMELQIRAVGEVVYDEGRLADVSLRMSGWVQKLLVAETGQKVKRGQTLFTLYSPELYAAQLEHLATVKRASGASDTFASLARASKNRLRLLGMSDGQIRQLERRGTAQENVPIAAPASGYIIEKNVVEGAEVKAGTQVYRIADLDKIWIDARVYEPDLPHVKLGQKVTVELPYVPGKTYPGTVDYIYPTLDAQTRTGTIRVVLDNPDLALKPDMYATARIDVPLGERLAIPDSAVLYSGPRRIVFVDLNEGRLRPQEVELGAFAGGLYEVVSGLEAGDTVVTSGNFLIAAESRLRSATTFWAAEKDPDKTEGAKPKQNTKMDMDVEASDGAR